ncbi:hypothetical protein WDU94_010833 [Cyamophila willieti]
MWESFHSLTGKNEQELDIILKNNNQNIKEPEKIAEIFAKYFIQSTYEKIKQNETNKQQYEQEKQQLAANQQQRSSSSSSNNNNTTKFGLSEEKVDIFAEQEVYTIKNLLILEERDFDFLKAGTRRPLLNKLKEYKAGLVGSSSLAQATYAALDGLANCSSFVTSWNDEAGPSLNHLHPTAYDTYPQHDTSAQSAGTSAQSAGTSAQLGGTSAQPGGTSYQYPAQVSDLYDLNLNLTTSSSCSESSSTNLSSSSIQSLQHCIDEEALRELNEQEQLTMELIPPIMGKRLKFLKKLKSWIKESQEMGSIGQYLRTRQPKTFIEIANYSTLYRTKQSKHSSPYTGPRTNPSPSVDQQLPSPGHHSPNNSGNQDRTTFIRSKIVDKADQELTPLDDTIVDYPTLKAALSKCYTDSRSRCGTFIREANRTKQNNPHESAESFVQKFTLLKNTMNKRIRTKYPNSDGTLRAAIHKMLLTLFLYEVQGSIGQYLRTRQPKTFIEIANYSTLYRTKQSKHSSPYTGPRTNPSPSVDQQLPSPGHHSPNNSGNQDRTT